MLGRRL